MTIGIAHSGRRPCRLFPQATPDDLVGSSHLPHMLICSQVAVADLDLKPLEKIDEHYDLDCAIMYQAKQQRLAALLS
jgi:hypothetical protein